MVRGETDELEGRIEGATGALTGDEKLKREGRRDQAGARAPAAEKAFDEVRGPSRSCV